MQSLSEYFSGEVWGSTPRQQGPREGFKAEKWQGQLSSLWPAGVSEEGRKATEKGPLSSALM